MTTEFLLVEVPATATVDGPDGWMLAGMAEVERADKMLVYGHPDYAETVRDLAVSVVPTEYQERRWAVAVPREGPRTVVGLVRMDLPISDNTHMTWAYLCVHPDWRRQGVGTLLLDWAESVATEAGRTTWLHYLDLGVPAPGVPTVVAPEGGAIAAEGPGWRFADKRGYTLEQVERLSVLDVPVDEALLAPLEADAVAHGDGYRLHTWVDEVPAEWRASYTALLAQFLTEAPSAGLDYEPEVWDVARLEEIMRRTAARGRTALYAVAEHLASGTLVAATELEDRGPESATASQGLTLVLPGYRGHRLGMAVKIANLRQLARVLPAIRRVHTGNAAENDHMLAINRTLGFRPEGVEATVRKLVGTTQADS